MADYAMGTSCQGRLHRYLDDNGQSLTIERHWLPDFLLQANELLQADRPQEARAILSEDHIALVAQIVETHPELTDLMYILAKLLQDVELTDQAIAWYERILAVEPHVDIYRRLSDLVPVVRATELLSLAHELAPENFDIGVTYGNRLLDCGRIEEGVAQLQQAFARRPEAFKVQESVLWHQHYLPDYDEAYFHREYLRWAERFFTVDSQLKFSAHGNHKAPDKRLKLGIVSGEFTNNTAISPFESIFSHFDREQFEFYAYSNGAQEDIGTQRWRQLTDVFHEIRALDDYAVAQLIVKDGIDILFEVGGYCKGARMRVFAFQPAPVQVDYGMLSTLGIPEIRYRLFCPSLNTPDGLEHSLETQVHLSPMWHYAPPSPSPAIGPLPAKVNGYVTFGSFNNHRKINDYTLDLWAQVLQQVPTARMVLKFPDGNDSDLAQLYLDRFEQRGIRSPRVTVLGQCSFTEHLEYLTQCDILLDTFPFNAARGTFEALWMGVPTVSLAGQTHVSRVGLSRQKAFGLEIFAAHSPREYVDKAVSFAQQWDSLEAIRTSLRVRMLQSDICDPQAWAFMFQETLRGLWRQWCRDGGTENGGIARKVGLPEIREP